MTRSLMGSFVARRRPELADLMLLGTVGLWGLTFTVTKYVLEHGFQPLAYGCLRFSAAATILGSVAYGRERTLALRRRDMVLLTLAALIGISLNQVTFVYATKLTTATTVALLFGTLPVMAGLFAFVQGIERMGTRFWIAACFAFGGAALVAIGSGGGVSGHLWGDLLAVGATVTCSRAGPLLRRYSALRVSAFAFVAGTIDLLAVGATVTWAWYSVAAAPILSRYSALRVSAFAFVAGTIPLLAIGSKQLATQDYGFPPSIWLAHASAVLGPLVAANLLWFGAISRVGPSRAAVFANLQPVLRA